MPDPSLLQRLKERKLVQWALAYSAGAWVLYEVVDTVGDRWGLSNAFFQGLSVVLGIGLLIILVLAWYHGEKGHQRVSGPELFMVAGLLLVAGVALSMVGNQGETAPLFPTLGEDNRPGIAVLPCANMSADPADEYLASALHDEILLKLQRITSLFSIGRSSVEWYLDHPAPPTQIARELGVGFVGECSVQKYENQIRLIFQLLDGNTGGHVWADDYDRDLTVGNLFDIQSEIAQQVASGMRAALGPGDRNRLAQSGTESTDAYQAYLRGTQAQFVLTRDGLETAERYFNLALEIDPDYAAPWAGISRVWVARQQMGIVSPNEAFREAKAAVEKALALDETEVAAHRALASILTWGDWDWPAAERQWRELIRLDPDDADVLNGYSHFLMIMGRPEEAMEAMARALQLDPFNLKIRSFYVVDLLFVRRYDDAIAEAREIMHLQPSQPVARSSLYQALFLTGRFEEALAMDRETVAPDSELRTALELGYEEGGYAGAQQRLADIIAGRSGTPGEPDAFSVSVRYLFAGDHERSIQWLERAFPDRGGFLPYLVAPLHEPLRSDLRFQDLLRRMNLPG